MRRLPVYVLFDCSESMIGPGIAAVRKSLEDMLSELRRNPHALETVYLSFIAFSTKACQLMPLTPLVDVQPPSLPLASGTALGDALALAGKSIKTEVVKGTADKKGDFRAIVFIVTDGVPTDKWQTGASALQATKATVYAIGCGDDVDWRQLGEITPNVLHIDAMDKEGFGSLFRWISSSVDTASRAVGDGEDKTAMDKLPEAVRRIDLSKAPIHDGNPRQLLLKSTCYKTGTPYLMRFRFSADRGCFEPLSSHPLSPDDMGAAAGALHGPKISTKKLDGNPPCPCCEATDLFVCECQEIACWEKSFSNKVVCPSCRKSLTLVRGHFDVNQRTG
jgi:uncharacterized protein YegL